MGNAYTQSDVNQILNNPGVFYFRPYGSTGEYIRSVFTNGSTFSYTPDVFTQGFDDTGDVFDAIGTENGEIAFDFGKVYDLNFMQSLSGGLFTKEVTSAGAQVVENQVIAAGWTDKEAMTINLIDSDGKYYTANGEPAITSVTGATAGVLTANDDYTIVPSGNSQSGYSIVLNTAGTAELVTSEVVTIVFNSPTVVGETSLFGGGKKNYDAIEGYYDTELLDGTNAKIYFYKGQFNGNLNVNFGTENSPEAAVTSVGIKLKNVTTRDAGKQMFAIVKGE